MAGLGALFLSFFLSQRTKQPIPEAPPEALLLPLIAEHLFASHFLCFPSCKNLLFSERWMPL